MTDEVTDNSSISALSGALSGGALVFVGKGVSLSLNFLTQSFLAHSLSSEAYGDVVLFFAILGILGAVTTLGLDQGVVRYLPGKEDELPVVRSIVRTVGGFSILVGLSVAAVLFMFGDELAHLVNYSGIIPFISLIAVTVPFIVLRKVSVGIARSLRDSTVHVATNLVSQPILRFGSIVVLVTIGLNETGAVMGHFFAICSGTIISILLVRRVLPPITGVTDGTHLSIVSFSLPLLFVQGMNFLLADLDTLMIGYYLTSNDVGVYNPAYLLSTLVLIPISTTGYLIPSVISHFDSQGDHGTMRNVYRTSTKWISFIAFPIFLAIFWFSPLVLSIVFGSSYRDGATPLRILAISTLFAALMGATEGTLTATGKNRLLLFISLVTVTVNFLLNVALIPTYGIIGAALASAVAILLRKLLSILFLYREVGLHPFGVELYVPVLGTSLISGLSMLVASENLQSLVLFILSMSIYILLIMRCGITDQDKHIAQDIQSRTEIPLQPLIRLLRGSW